MVRRGRVPFILGQMARRISNQVADPAILARNRIQGSTHHGLEVAQGVVAATTFKNVQVVFADALQEADHGRCEFKPGALASIEGTV